MKNCVLFAGFAAAALLCGCKGEPPGALVRGKVTYKGAPLTQGSIVFYPNGSGLPAAGLMQPDGTFQLLNTQKTERIEPGKYIVIVVAGTERIDAVSEDPLAKVKPVVPFMFSSVASSPIKYDVALGENQFDVNLDEFAKNAAAKK